MNARPLSPETVVRTATDADLGAIVALAGAALGWRAGEPNDELFRWKHLANPFGASPQWVAEVDGQIAAFRTLLRWEWDAPDGSVRRAVRAVDTATHPDFQGRGLFRLLTTQAVEEVRADGVSFVFNTPNDQSRPGYLKMGWREVGRVPVAVAVRGPGSAAKLARARVPADKWSLPTDVGDDAAAVLASAPDDLDELLAAQPAPRGLRTRRSPGFLRWRYADGPLDYRALLVGPSVRDGIALFRLRRRGGAVEATLCDALVPGGDRRREAKLVAAVVGAARPDYLIRVQRSVRLGRCVRVPGQGPLLTWRGLDAEPMPSMDRWDLCLGDIELF